MEYEEDGSGAGGYAKEMSDGWKQVWLFTVLSSTSNTGTRLFSVVILPLLLIIRIVVPYWYVLTVPGICLYCGCLYCIHIYAPPGHCVTYRSYLSNFLFIIL